MQYGVTNEEYVAVVGCAWSKIQDGRFYLPRMPNVAYCMSNDIRIVCRGFTFCMHTISVLSVEHIMSARVIRAQGHIICKRCKTQHTHTQFTVDNTRLG